MASKITTGLVGLAVEANPHQKLKNYYARLLGILNAMPQEAEYRKKTEILTKQRLDSVNKTTDISVLEKMIGAGQIELVLQEARNEVKLAQKMAEWKPWQLLRQDAPPGQWDWP